MNRPAADLVLRHDHVAAVLLQHAGRGPVRVAEHHVAHAAGEQRHAGPAASHGRQKLRQRRQRLAQRRQHRHQLPQPRRQQPPQAGADQQPIEPSAARSAPAAATCRSLLGIRKQPEQNLAMKPVVGLLLGPLAAACCSMPRETARSACRTARPRGTPFRRPGSRGTAPDAAALRGSVPAGRRSPPASDRCGRAGCRSRSPFRHRSGTRPCTARSARNRETARSRSPRRDFRWPRPARANLHQPRLRCPGIDVQFFGNCRIGCHCTPVLRHGLPDRDAAAFYPNCHLRFRNPPWNGTDNADDCTLPANPHPQEPCRALDRCPRTPYWSERRAADRLQHFHDIRLVRPPAQPESSKCGMLPPLSVGELPSLNTCCKFPPTASAIRSTTSLSSKSSKR